MSETYLITMTASGSFYIVLNKIPWRALNAIKREFSNFWIPTKICLKILVCVVQPIVLCGSEAWGPLSPHSHVPTEPLHAEFCRYSLIINAQKSTQNFKSTQIRPPSFPKPPNTRQQDQSPEEYPLSAGAETLVSQFACKIYSQKYSFKCICCLLLIYYQETLMPYT